jgi:hypothetical protein
MAGIAALDITGALVSSAVVAAIVGGLSSFLTQRYLLERKAQVDYEFMARKRLNEAIGPLRMQLLFSARDVVGRVRWHAGTTPAAESPSRPRAFGSSPAHRRAGDTRRQGSLVRAVRSSSCSESPMSQNIGGHRPTKSARRSALPRSS